MKRTIILFAACLAIFSLGVSFVSVGEEGSAKPRLAPGVLITIPPEVDYSDTYNRADMVELLATLPNPDPELADDVRFDKEIWARNVRYSRDVWCLQFSFKPVRIIYVDIPNKEGTFDKKAVWYLVYNVKNTGPAAFDRQVKERTVQTEDDERTVQSTEYSLDNPGGSLSTAVEQKSDMPVAHDTKTVSESEQKTLDQTRDTPLVLRNLQGTFQPAPAEVKPITFVPQFVLATDHLVLDTSTENNPETGQIESKADIEKVSYVDQVIPIALGPIMTREGMSARPETTVSFPRKEIKPGEGFWGVAMWTDIDPRINRFSIFVSGLTNAYRWSDHETPQAKPGAGRRLERKALQTNWWRRGDRYTVDDTQIQYGQPGELDYLWIFR